MVVTHWSCKVHRYPLDMSIKTSVSPNSRSPLGDSTNELSIPDRNLVAEATRNGGSRRLRHKASIRAIRSTADSSESLPSSHSSIFEALCYSPSTESLDEKAPWAATFVAGGRSPPAWRDIDIASTSLERTPKASLIRSVHHPTPLETITEQKSIATLRPQASFSSPSGSSVRASIGKRASPNTLTPTAGARRKKSFSFDDLLILRRSSRLFKNSTSSSHDGTAAPLASNVYYPTVPDQAPPVRTPTPPGLPTFNTPAASSYRLPPPNMRFRDYFRTTRTPEEREWTAQTAALPRGVIMRGEDGVVVRGRWKAGQSGHTGNLGRTVNLSAMHDSLYRAPTTNTANGRHVTFSGSVRGGEDESIERMHLRQLEQPQNADETAVPGMDSNMQSIQGNGNSGHTSRTEEEKESRWFKLGELFCYVCCGAEMSEDGLLHPNVVHRVGRNGQPMYARPISLYASM